MLQEKEWYNKEDILELYPIGITTYKQRIKRLKTPELSGFTRMVSKPLKDCNLKTIQVREIHQNGLDKLFGDVRVPDLKNVAQVIKWVNNTTWNWFGDVIPCGTYPFELQGKMHYLFKQLKKLNRASEITLFYSIEKNPEDKYFHSHFLIKDEQCKITKEVLLDRLELIAEKNTPRETRIYLKPYDYKTHGRNGSNYTLKDFRYGYEILK